MTQPASNTATTPDWAELGAVLVIIPTYNEAENIGPIVARLRAAVPDADVLIADDNSPDGTGRLADDLAAADDHVHVLHRKAKEGLGATYVASFRWGLERGYGVLVEHDADGSHQPEQLPSMLRAHLSELFPNRTIEQFSQFRVTRHSDLAVDEDDVGNLLAALREGLQQRHYGRAVRIEVSSNCSEEFATLLCRQFELPPQALYRVHGPVNLARMAMLIDLVKRPDLMFTPFQPVYPLSLQGQPSLFDRIRQGDVLVHQPFEKIGRAHV